MTYDVKLKPKFVRALKKIDKKQAERILVKVYLLGTDQYTTTSKQLRGIDARRLRIGDYRVLYTVENTKLIVLVLTVGHRKDVYH